MPRQDIKVCSLSLAGESPGKAGSSQFSEQVNVALSQHITAPSGIHGLLRCLPLEMPALKLSLQISSGCVLCDLPPLQLRSPTGGKEVAVLGWSGEAGASL